MFEQLTTNFSSVRKGTVNCAGGIKSRGQERPRHRGPISA